MYSLEDKLINIAVARNSVFDSCIADGSYEYKKSLEQIPRATTHCMTFATQRTTVYSHIPYTYTVYVLYSKLYDMTIITNNKLKHVQLSSM